MWDKGAERRQEDPLNSFRSCLDLSDVNGQQTAPLLCLQTPLHAEITHGRMI